MAHCSKPIETHVLDEDGHFLHCLVEVDTDNETQDPMFSSSVAARPHKAEIVKQQAETLPEAMPDEAETPPAVVEQNCDFCGNWVCSNCIDRYESQFPRKRKDCRRSAAT